MDKGVVPWKSSPPITFGLLLVAATGALASDPWPTVVARKQFWRVEDRGNFTNGPILKFGSPLSMTPGSRWYSYGRNYMNAWEFFFDWYINTYGGIRVNGTKYAVELVMVDSKSNKDKVSWGMKQMLDEGIDFFLADYSSGLTRPQAQMVQDAGKVLIAGGSSMGDVYLNRPNVFGMLTSGDLFMEGALKVVGRADNSARKTMWYAAESGRAIQDLCAKVPEWAQHENIELLNSLYVLDSSVDENDEVNKVFDEIQSLNPDVIMFCTYKDWCFKLVRQLKKRLYMPKAAIFTSCINDERYFSEVGDAGQYILGQTAWLPTLSLSGPLTPGWTAVSWSQEYERRFGIVPVYQITAVFMCAATMVRAIEDANSLDPADVIRVLKDFDMDSLYGQVTFGEQGQSSSPMKIIQFQQSEDPMLVYPFNVAGPFVYPMPSWEERDCLNVVADYPMRFGFLNNTCTVCPVGRSSTVVNGTRICKDCNLGTSGTLYEALPVCIACPRGKFSQTEGSTDCAKCPAGTRCSSTGCSSCEICREGSMSKLGATECASCDPGFFQAGAGNSACEACTSGSYTNVSGAIRCMTCGEHFGIDGFTTIGFAATSPRECACPQGAYIPCHGSSCLASQFSLSNGGCTGCPQGFTCPGGLETVLGEDSHKQPLLEPGHFALVETPYCANLCGASGSKDLCPGARPAGVCGGSNVEEGNSCIRCKEGYFKREGMCMPCEMTFAIFLVLLLVFGALTLVAVVYALNGSRARQHNAVIALGVSFSFILYACQVLNVFRQLTLQWPAVVYDLMSAASFISLDLEMLRVECLFKSNDFGSYAFSIFVFPGLALAVTAIAAFKNRRETFQQFRIETTHTLGSMGMALFLAMVAPAVQPFIFYKHPCGMSSLMYFPNIYVGSEEYTPFAAVGVIFTLLMPLPAVSFCLFAVRRYATLGAAGDITYLRSHRFLFAHFRKELYFYGMVIIFRNLFLSLVPVIVRGDPVGQYTIVSVIVLVHLVFQAKWQPWRIRQISWLETFVNASILELVCLGGLLTETPSDTSAMENAGILLVVVFGLGLSGTIFYGAFWALVPHPLFSFFVCHSKGDAGMQARVLQLTLQKFSIWPSAVFLDADHLSNLDTLFDTVRSRVRNLVVFLSKSTLTRPWCAGEIVTAVINKVPIIVVRCEDFVEPEDVVANVSKMFDYSASGLANYEISMEQVGYAFKELLEMDYITAPPNLGREEISDLALAITERSTRVRVSSSTLMASCQSIKSVTVMDSSASEMTSTPSEKASPKDAIFCDTSDNEAMSGAMILFGELATDLHGEIFLQAASGQCPTDTERVHSYLAGSKKCQRAAIILSHSFLSSRENVELVMITTQRFIQGNLSVVPVVLPGFEYPGAKYFSHWLPRIMQEQSGVSFNHVPSGELLQAAERLLKQFFKIIGVKLDTMGSITIIQSQAMEIRKRMLNLQAKKSAAESKVHESKEDSFLTPQCCLKDSRGSGKEEGLAACLPEDEAAARASAADGDCLISTKFVVAADV